MKLLSPLVGRSLAALVIGVAFPYVELAWKCSEWLGNSEACVWGRAYLSLSRWVEPIIITPIAFFVLSVVARALSRRIDPPAA